MGQTAFLKRSDCPVCQSVKWKPLYQKPYGFEPLRRYLYRTYSALDPETLAPWQDVMYSLVECQECNLIFQEYVPSEGVMNTLYEGWIDPEKALAQQQSYGLSYYSFYSQDILQILAYINRPPASLKVFDFGMGWGKWALMAKAFGCDVYGSELSEQRSRYAAANGIQVLDWSAIPEYSFDLINTDQVFEHLADPVGTLAHLVKALKPEGFIKICVPNSFGIRYRLHKMDWSAPKGSLRSLNPVAPLEHINCFSLRSLHQLGKEAGLDVVQIPLMVQYQYTTAWSSPKRITRNLAMPLLRNLLGLQNYVLFRKR